MTESKPRLIPDESAFIYTSKMSPMIWRNLEVLEALEAIARILSLVPPKSWQTVRYFAWYSHKASGMRKKRGQCGIERIEPTSACLVV